MPWRPTVDFQREAIVLRLPDGTPVYTYFQFGLIALLVTAPLWLQGRLSSMAIAVLLIPIMYASVLAHELGHKTAAWRQQARTTEIEIGFYGGIAHLEWDYHRGIAMRPVALAGPVVSLGLAGLFFALYWLTVQSGASDAPRYFEPLEALAIVSRTFYLAFLLNLWLALFNLLPAYPLDGGVIAEDLLAERLGARRARLIVGFCGVVIAAVAIVVAFAMALAGTPVLLLASFRANLDAIRQNWARRPPPTSQPPRERVASIIQFKKRGGNS